MMSIPARRPDRTFDAGRSSGDSQRLTIFHLHNSRAVGGVEVSLVGWMRHADRRRFCPELFCFDESDGAHLPFLEYLSRRGMAAHVLPWSGRKYAFKSLSQLVRAIRAKRPAIVHTHDVRPDFVGFVAARAAGCPVIATNHGWHSIWSGLERKRRRQEAARARILRHFDLVIAVADSVREECIRRGVDSNRVITLHTGIDLETFRPTATRAGIRAALGFGDSELVIGNIARLHPEKGHANLITAFARIAGRVPCARLLIVGEGPLRSELIAAADTLRVADRVKFVGFQDDIAAIYSALDVFALPSLSEGAPLVVYKAAVSGLPIIASDVAGVHDLLEHGETALLVCPGDVDALARALVTVAENCALRATLACRARESACEDSRYSISCSTARLEAIYDGLAAEKLGFEQR